MASVLLSTNEPILAEGLARVLSSAEDLDFLAFSPRMEELIGLIEQHRPDLLLIDMTAGLTFHQLRELHQSAAGNTKIILWVHEISTELALQAMSMGVRGILRKTVTTETLVRCLRRVNEGELWFEKALSESIMSARRYSLTRREGQLVSLLSQGLKNKEIATALEISEGTVKVYLSRLFQKLGVKDRFELALYGLKNLSAVTGDDRAEGQRPVASVWQPPRSIFLNRLPPGAEIGQRSLPVSRLV